MKGLLFLAPISLFYFLGVDCAHSPIDPGNNLLDTTSHAFTFHQFSWGGGGGSFLSDVAILSDTNIWAVGEIQPVQYDSTGQRIYTPYGAANWDGVNWKLLKLPTSYGLSYTSYLTPTGIIAFTPNDIWLANGGVHKFNGQVVTQSYWINKFPGNPGILDEGQNAEKVWGTSDNNLYVVGRKGGLAYFNGTSWQKLSTGTQLDITDIYGATNPRTGELEILALATQIDSLPSQTELLRIQGTTVSLITTLPKVYFSLWFVPGEKYFLVGDGIISKNSLTDSAWTNSPIGTITRNASGTIRGTALNDIFVVGAYLDVTHYNGSTWYDYANEIPTANGGFSRVALRGDVMIAVGFVDQDAVLLMGKR
jgi:hypothetical protein